MKKSMREALQAVIDIADNSKPTRLSLETFNKMKEYLLLKTTGLNHEITPDRIRVEGGKVFEIYKKGDTCPPI